MAISMQLAGPFSCLIVSSGDPTGLRSRRGGGAAPYVRCGRVGEGSAATALDANFDKKVFRHNFTRSENYNRKGFGHKKETLDLMNQEYTNDVIKTLKENGNEYTWGDVTVKLAESYGFCWGVERAVQIAYEARKQFPEEKIWITNQIIHNPTVNKPVSENKYSSLHWEDYDEKIDMATLSSKEPILFYDEVVLYEDELSDSGVSLLTIKVRVMPSCWFLLLRFWLRVDGALMRLRDTRVYCSFGSEHQTRAIILRDSCWREATVQSLSAVGHA